MIAHNYDNAKDDDDNDDDDVDDDVDDNRVWFKFGNYIEQRASKSSLDVVQIVLHEKDS